MDFMNPRLPLGDWVNDFLTWFTSAFQWLLDFINLVLGGLYDVLYLVFSSPIYLVMIVILAAIAFFAAGWKVAVFTLIGFYFVRALDQWDNTMSTLALVLVAVIVALIIAIPLGILAAKVSWVSTVVKPILDFMQSMPALAYLVPAILMFGIGQTPGAIATIIFALPPGVRLTELAIRQVNTEVVEAGQAFGASSGHILSKIQIPLAMPTIMAGINQVIMLALSMVVLAGMVGAGGLGGAVVGGISSLDVPLAVEAGLAVVVVAIFLDRVTAALGKKTPIERAHKAAAA
ncbi:MULTISPECIES: ABC transporter permease [unclassified Brevibacterium]|uniref:ABC transporter permease n=1 Tax=unclassified Brevibacterium TaxID=2614124 RepID=UPI001091FDAE|nr:ABC transporter permease subunit [Brevibacterium sp. S22]